MAGAMTEQESACRHAVHAMGTRFEVVAHHPDAALARAACEAAMEEVLRLHALWSPFERSSTIAKLNQAPVGVGRRLDRDTLDLLLACQRLHTRTGGLFDPTIGTLMAWWGFRGDDCGRARSEPKPHWGMDTIGIDDRSMTAWRSDASITLDLGAIGKGAALDAAGVILRDAGIESALLHAGTSSVLAIGAPPEALEGWRVQVGNHGPTVSLKDASLSVSEVGGRMVAIDGKDIGHILDPRSGEPVMGRTLAAVVCDSALDADAWSTALLVGGEASEVRWAYVV